MGKRKRGLTQNEIWDDSALIESWEQVLEEYKYYHSIEANGEKVEDVLCKYEEEETAAKGLAGESEAERIQVADLGVSNGESPRSAKDDNPSAVGGQFVDGGVSSEIPTAVFADLPSQLVSNNEALKNLMMSWYYAGYYTGLYEGRQRHEKQKGLSAAEHPE